MRFIAVLWFLAAAAGCSSDDDPTRCGSGTVEVDGRCEREGEGGGAGLACGDGTREQDGECVPDREPEAWYELRTAAIEIGADGISRIPILALGENADGTAARDQMVLSLSRGDAGELLSSTATLGELGAVVYFRPCNAIARPECTGPLELSMALSTDPARPVATLRLDLVEPAPVYTAEPCLVGGSAMFVEGDGWVYTGTLGVTDGEWSIFRAEANLVEIDLRPADEEAGPFWFFRFGSQQLGAPLAPGVYERAEGYPFETNDRPGLNVTGGSGCNTISGRFQVHEYERSETGVESVTISFEQYCEPYDPTPLGYLNGCVHYEP